MEFISTELDNYVCEHTDKEPKLLDELNRKTNLEVLRPRMLSGHFQGRALSMLSKMIKPNRILEIGTYTGYSALCFAEGLNDGGKVITIDINEELEEIIKEHVDKSPLKDKIELLVGNALHIIPTIKEQFDIVFIDADKQNYSNYYDLVFDKVKIGGYIIADNVLWSGKVLEKINDNDKETSAIISYNSKVQNDKRVENVLFPIRDGILIARKTAN